jgi:hypothetical protein
LEKRYFIHQQLQQSFSTARLLVIFKLHLISFDQVEGRKWRESGGGGGGAGEEGEGVG